MSEDLILRCAQDPRVSITFADAEVTANPLDRRAGLAQHGSRYIRVRVI
ncbi:hypothetical protein [Crossiella sp. CA198]